jgi:hypothetical protein
MNIDDISQIGIPVCVFFAYEPQPRAWDSWSVIVLTLGHSKRCSQYTLCSRGTARIQCGVRGPDAPSSFFGGERMEERRHLFAISDRTEEKYCRILHSALPIGG